MAKRKTNTKRPAAKSTAPRQLKRPSHRTLRLTKRIKHPGTVPSVWKLWRLSWRRLMTARWLFLGLLVIYAILTLFLVRGFGSLNLSDLKGNLQLLFHGKWGEFTTGFTLFGVLLSSAGGGPTASSGLYQSLLLIIFSLVFIWSLRQVQAEHKVGLRDAFYKSLYPLVPFLLVLLVIGLQLVPMLLGSVMYST